MGDWSLDGGFGRMNGTTRRGFLAAGLAGAVLAPRIAAAGPSSVAAEINFSSLAGGSDDAKLAGFCTKYATAIAKPTLVLDELRAYYFAAQQQIFSGFALVGAGRRAVDQQRAENVVPQYVNLDQPSLRGWLTLPSSSTVWGLYLGGLSFNATPTSRLFEPNAGCVIWTSTFRDISWQNGPSLFGSSAVMQPWDACVLDGYWNVNNVTEQAFHVGGADVRMVPSTLLLDSLPSYMPTSGFLMRLTSQSKTTLANAYMTAHPNSALRISDTNQMLRIRDCEFEGMNANSPCAGALIVSTDSYVQLTDSWVSFGMANPAATGRGDGGLISVSSGRFEVLNCHTQRAAGVPETSPFVYATGQGTRVVVRNAFGEGYAGKPVVRVVNGATADVDASVTLVTT